MRKYLTAIKLSVALLSTAVLAMCSTVPSHAQVINPGQPGNVVAGTGVSVVGSTVSVNYGLTSATAIQGNQIIPVTNGGTGIATVATGSILVGNGASAFTLAAPSASGTVLTSNGVGVAPSFQAVGGASATITLANVAALRAFSHLVSQFVNTQAYAASGDKGGASYWMVSATTGAFVDDGCNVIVAADGAVWSFANSQYINILACGAKNDGVISTGAGTVNTTAIQNAVTDAGSAAIVPPGVFVTGQIVIPSGRAIFGYGMGVSNLLAQSSFNTTTGLVYFNGTGATPTTVRDLTITAPTGGSGAAAVGLNLASKNSFVNSVAVNTFNAGITVGGTDSNLDSVQTNGNSTGMKITTVYLDGSVIVNNYHSQGDIVTGLAISASSNVQVSNSSFGAATGAFYTTAGLSVATSDHISLSNIDARLGAVSTAGVGIFVSASTYVAVNNSTVANFFYGIQFAQSGNLSVQGNFVHNAQFVCIAGANTTINSSVNVISDNLIFECGNTATLAAQTSAGILWSDVSTNSTTVIGGNTINGVFSTTKMYTGISTTVGGSGSFCNQVGNVSKNAAGLNNSNSGCLSGASALTATNQY